MWKEKKNAFADQISHVMQYLVDKIAYILEILRRWMDSKS